MSRILFYLPNKEFVWVKQILKIASANPELRNLLTAGDDDSTMKFIDEIFNNHRKIFNNHLSLSLTYSTLTAAHILRNNFELKKLGTKTPKFTRINGMHIEDYIADRIGK